MDAWWDAMRRTLLPDHRNLEEHPLFAIAIYGEIACIVFNLVAIARMTAIDIGFAGAMLAFFTIHLILIWAWGQRFPAMDWLYRLWNVPSFLALIFLAAEACLALVVNGGSSRGGVHFGDASMSFFGLVAALTALSSRGAGLWWSFMVPKSIEHRRSWGISGVALLAACLLIGGFVIFKLGVTDSLLTAGMGFYELGISM